jgi:hypothetical protein
MRIRGLVLVVLALIGIGVCSFVRTESATVIGSHAVLQASPCFAVDPGMASIMRNDHLGWAQQQDSGRLAANLDYKIALVFDCGSVTGDMLARSFGTMSTIVAAYAPNPACFNNDSGMTNRDALAHENWARFKTRSEVKDNLRWKAAAAFRCLDRSGQIGFFADMSVAVAKVPTDNVGPASSGNCRAEAYSISGVPPARPGQQVSVHYTAPSNHSASDWIGIFRSGDGTPLSSARVPDKCGYVVLVAPGAGEYEVFYVIANSPNQMSPHAHLSVR